MDFRHFRKNMFRPIFDLFGHLDIFPKNKIRTLDPCSTRVDLSRSPDCRSQSWVPLISGSILGPTGAFFMLFCSELTNLLNTIGESLEKILKTIQKTRNKPQCCLKNVTHAYKTYKVPQYEHWWLTSHTSGKIIMKETAFRNCLHARVAWQW